MKRLFSYVCLWLTMSTVLLPANAALAAGADKRAQSAELKQRADRAFDELQYREAADSYARAYALSHDPALLYNRGRALQALGDYPRALDELERFSKEAAPALKAKVPKLEQLLAEVRAKVAKVVVTANVVGAEIRIRDMPMGRTPLPGPLRVSAGAASVEVTAEGYAPFRRLVDLSAASNTTIVAELVRTTGILTVRSPAPEASVFVDRELFGRAPIERPVATGRHVVEVRAPGREDAEVTVVVRPGEQRDVQLDLAKARPLTGKWWFWAGVGAVVVAGVVTTAFVLSERGADSGSFEPGRVSGPLVQF